MPETMLPAAVATMDDTALHVRVEEKAADVLLRIEGTVHDHQVDDLRRQLIRILARKAVVVIDLAAVTQMGSLALGALVEFRRRMRRRAGVVRIAGVQPTVSVAFRVMRLDELFPMFATVEEALNSAAA